jgi:hypothetical protein
MTFPKDGNHWELNPGPAMLRLRVQTETKIEVARSLCHPQLANPRIWYIELSSNYREDLAIVLLGLSQKNDLSTDVGCLS